MSIKNLQNALGVPADGIAGPATFTALFRKCGASADRAAELAIAANVHFPAYGIMDSPLRLAHFMAQLMHESASFTYMEEIASGAEYEGRKDLGNTQTGDGRRYKGRGPIQLTGRANYRAYGKRLGIDFERHPEIVATPSIGLHVALEYWKQTGLNALADADDVLTITKRINGGTNGLADRKAHLAKLKGWLNMMRGLSEALRGIGGAYELNRLVGAAGGVAYIIGANAFVIWNLAHGREFDLTEYCIAFPGGLAVVVGAIAGAVAIKDRNVAAAKKTEAETQP